MRALGWKFESRTARCKGKNAPDNFNIIGNQRKIKSKIIKEMKSKICESCFLHTIDFELVLLTFHFLGIKRQYKDRKEIRRRENAAELIRNRLEISNLEDQAGGVGDPLGVAGNAGESSGESLGASGAGSEADDADLVVNTSVDEAQWAARVSLCRNKNTN
jgi:hypothetical protein